jgi:hypothetical protein
MGFDIGSAIGGGLDSVISGIQGLIPGVNDARNAQGAYQDQIKALIDRIQNEWNLPKYDQTPLTQQEYTLLNTYAPQVAGFVQQEAPQLLANVSNEGTQAQSQALNQLSDLSKTGVDAGTKAQYEEANMSADQALRSNRANALNLLAQRGLGSSGATLNADIGAGIGAADQQRRAALQAAADASQRKVQAIQGLGSLGSQIAGQQQQKDEFNANTLNQYNQLLANRRQQYENYAAQTQNQANMYNQQQAQGIANANTGIANQTNLANRQRQDQIESERANLLNQRLQLEAGLQSGAAGQQLGYANQQAQNKTGMFMNIVGMAMPPSLNQLQNGIGPASSFFKGSKQGGGGSAVSGGGDNQPSGGYGNMNSNYSFGGYGADQGQGDESQNGGMSIGDMAALAELL